MLNQDYYILKKIDYNKFIITYFNKVLLIIKIIKMDFFSSNYVHTNSFNVLLPNLRYKNNDGIYFKSKNPIKLEINNKTIFKNEFLLKDLAYSQTLNYMDIDIHCTIIKIEYDDGLKMNIKYDSNEYNYTSFMQKIARYIEASILGINIDESDYEYTDYSEEYYDNKIKEFTENISIYSEEIYEEISESDNISNENNESYIEDNENKDNQENQNNIKFHDDKN